jgi:hypothetical protein
MSNIHFIFLLHLVVLTVLPATGQQDSSNKAHTHIVFSGGLDAYYIYDFNRPGDAIRQPFLYNHNRHNEFNINHGILHFELSNERYRGNLGLHGGTYVQDNYAHEPIMYRPFYEANAGISLNKTNSLWLDAGILGSHIGFENAISQENLTLTRSLLAENSPYYLSGVKLTYTPTDKLEGALLICNGWQRIARLPGNSLPAFGSQLTLTPNEQITINWSTLVCSEFPDSTRKMRYFNNVYAQFDVAKKWKFITGFDFGIQQSSTGSTNFHQWYSPVIIAQYRIKDNLTTAVRLEHYNDQHAVIINSPNPAHSGFVTSGASWNLDYSRNEHLLLRMEVRHLNGATNYFQQSGQWVNHNLMIAFSLGIKFNEPLTKF